MAVVSKPASGIYAITSPNGKQYVGSAKSLRHRWSTHRILLRRGVHHSPYLQNAFNKYGEDNMVFSVLLFCDPINLIMYEQIAMDTMQPAYNILRHAGSPLGTKHSDETKAKISAANKGRMPSEECRLASLAANLGRKLSEHHKELLSKATKGRPLSPEHAKNIGLSRVGKKRKPETVEKIRLALTGRKLSPEQAEINRTMNIGRKRSPETIERMRASAKAFAENNKDAILARNREIHVGRKRPAETGAKISIARRNFFEGKKANDVDSSIFSH